jgi:hypothetical protein
MYNVKVQQLAMMKFLAHKFLKHSINFQMDRDNILLWNNRSTVVYYINLVKILKRILGLAVQSHFCGFA